MKIYDFHCATCDIELEELVGSSEAIILCPLCDEIMTVIMSATKGFVPGTSTPTNTFNSSL